MQRTSNCWGYLCFGVKEQHPFLADANHAWGGTATLADLLSQENIGAKQWQGGQNLWKKQESEKHSHHHHHQERRREERRGKKEEATHQWILFWHPEDWGTAWQLNDPHRRTGFLQCYCSSFPGGEGTPVSAALQRKTRTRPQRLQSFSVFLCSVLQHRGSYRYQKLQDVWENGIMVVVLFVTLQTSLLFNPLTTLLMKEAMEKFSKVCTFLFPWSNIKKLRFFLKFSLFLIIKYGNLYELFDIMRKYFLISVVLSWSPVRACVTHSEGCSARSWATCCRAVSSAISWTDEEPSAGACISCPFR